MTHDLRPHCIVCGCELPYDADKKQIRTAYFAFSRSFHPDTMFRKELGSFKPKMVSVF